MKKLACAALVAWSLLVAVAPAHTQSLPAALVWIPPESFTGWIELDALLRAHSEFKLTVALTPAMATAPARTVLDAWVAKGRLELAARIAGDPILTWVDSHPAAPQAQDALERAIEDRERLKKLLGTAPLGLVLGAGALDAPLASALVASGANWVLTGPYALPSASWASSGKIVFIPAGLLSEFSPEGWAAPGAGVYDESASDLADFLTVLGSMKDLPKPALGWALASDLLPAKAATHREIKEIVRWPSWDTAVAQTPTEPQAKANWNAYGAAAAALDGYQNSGAADLKTLDGATALLRKAQASRYYRIRQPTLIGGSATASLTPEFRARLLAVYKRLKLPAPDALYSSAAEGASSASSSEGPTGIKASAGPSWIEFVSPAGTVAFAPMLDGSTAAARAFVDGGAAADPWRIRGLRAQWDESAVRLSLRAAPTSALTPRPVYELYIDVNHVLGAGRVPLLEGRGAIVPARDAWELALSIVGTEARLYRARGGGDPEETASFKAVWDPREGAVTLSIPRALMRGNPSRWGWSVISLAEDPARAGRHPTAPLVAPDGTIVLGVLAAKDVQKAVLTRTNSRVPAARFEP